MNGTWYGPYELLRKIAAGGMAEVHLARRWGDSGFYREMVVKRLFPQFAHNPASLLLFQYEARVMAELAHPNIPQIFDLGECEDTWYIAMEYVPGVNLADLWRAGARGGTPMPLDVTLGIVIQICEALHHAHEAEDRGGNPLQIVHRDVTPHNIMITRDGVAKLMDFGIAQTNANRAEQRGVLRGTLAYMSPEQVRGRWLDRRADIFALGVVLYELTTGTRLFRGEDVQVMTSIVETDIRPPSTIVSGYPADLEAILMATLRRDRDHRIASASDLSAHLEHFGMRNGMMLGPRQVARYVTEVAPAQRVLEPELALVTNEPAPTQTLDSAAYALPLARPRADSGPFEDVQDLDLEELEPLEASVAFGGRDTLTDVPVVRGVEVPHRAAGAGAYAEGPAVILDTQKRVTAERSFLDELDRRLRDD
ncbi:MAG: serine/threonine protein kinase [Sandaracinaceae bacterium]|nr:serine/threonine protein kinase [Sandaracinaceae bacterium]MBP7680822.1 serine/threonine protein kinase [Deltaproteobacteria bacterium]MBK6810308.1 serine/threonine protein kinase [Sandaracinaceae bacterium]MBK7153678.1 serine/threonine protein kinase [Sandaracinaceae bacterium]MBK7775179.1 serine/threonine protein kinase [Sandaracinaceae bacterium]